VTLAATVAPAKDSRDFAGFYSLTHASAEGDSVRVTVTMQLFNYSGADLDQASVALRPAPPTTGAYGTYSPIEQWRDGTDVKIVMHITVPQAEYVRWDKRQPFVLVLNRDQQGRERERTVQVSRRPAIPLDDSSATQ